MRNVPELIVMLTYADLTVKNAALSSAKIQRQSTGDSKRSRFLSMR